MTEENRNTPAKPEFAGIVLVDIATKGNRKIIQNAEIMATILCADPKNAIIPI